MFEDFESSFSIVQLIYCSYATKFELGSEFERDLRDILDHSRAYNPLHDITGALMTDGRMLAQVVEGPPAAVRDLYSKITRDKRHNRVMMLQHTLVHVRLFDAWPAAFLRVLRYVQAFMTQTAHTLLANTTRRMDERLARWLLMTRDRLDGDELPLTQPFLSNMLGANRPGVTLAVQALGRAGLIRHVRGCITVLDRAGLETAAGGAYGVPEAEYARLFGPAR